MRTETFHTPGDLTVRVRVPVGRIELETVEGAEARVELESDPPIEEEAVIELRGNDLVVEIEERRLLFLRTAPRAQVRIACPPGARLDIDAVSADIGATGAYGRADVKTVSGDVRLGRIDGELAVKTVSGDAEVGGAGGRATLQSVSGDLRLEEAGGPVLAQTVSGDVRLGAVVEGAVELKSVSGDMHVGIRPGSRLWVDAKSTTGDTSSELELGDAPAAEEGPLVELRATSMSGDIRIVRA